MPERAWLYLWCLSEPGSRNCRVRPVDPYINGPPPSGPAEDHGTIHPPTHPFPRSRHPSPLHPCCIHSPESSSLLHKLCLGTFYAAHPRLPPLYSLPVTCLPQQTPPLLLLFLRRLLVRLLDAVGVERILRPLLLLMKLRGNRGE